MSVHEHDVRPLVRSIGAPPEQWRRADIEKECFERGIRVLNLRYPSLDGKLRELRVPLRSPQQLTRILAGGERVDGSSLFPGLFPSHASDLYVVPVYRWSFLDPWAEDEIHIVCRFLDADGRPCADTPDTALAAIAGRLRAQGHDLHALAELEFYILGDRDNNRFSARVQRNYHQGTPYLHQREVADEILRVTASAIGHVKYCHAEVGYIDQLQSEDPEIDGRRAEQYELELDLMPIDDLGTWLTVARWLVRTIADRHGASVTFVPKLDEGMAGNGMHLHLAVLHDGVNVMAGAGGELSEIALGTIGGLVRRVPSLAAFGNTVASSFLRLVPGQEAPTRVAWGHRNRGGVIRVPLAFSTPHRLDQTVNPDEHGEYPDDLARPTVELRLPDGSAFPQPLVAAVAAAVEAGLNDASAVEVARSSEMTSPPSEAAPDPERKIPGTVLEAAQALIADRAFYVQAGISGGLIDRIVERLQSEGDQGARLDDLPPAERLVESRRLMHKDLHKH